MVQRTYRWLLITLAVASFAIDQGSKYGVFRWLYNGGEFHEQAGNAHDVVPGWFRLLAQFDPSTGTCDCGFSGLQTWSAPIMPRVNHGALFGLGGNYEGIANGFFAAISLAAAAAILIWGTRPGPASEKWLTVALGLILGGTLGNLYDRVVFNGVRDFLHFYKIDWPVFNFADCCLVVGAALLLIQALLTPSDKPVHRLHQASCLSRAGTWD